MKQIHKEYDRPFLLESTKLTRLIGKIHERLADHPHLTTHDHFEVFLTGDRRDELTTIEEVLALENSAKRKIRNVGSARHVSRPLARPPSPLPAPLPPAPRPPLEP